MALRRTLLSIPEIRFLYNFCYVGMTVATQDPAYYIGWDVGGWNCDANRRSRDAIIILNSDLDMVGEAWRGNLSYSIQTATCAAEWVASLFALCKTEMASMTKVTLAIDAPLGFPEDLIRLATRQGYAESIATHANNSYLFRQTEKFLFGQGLKPLSAIKDMIGSQATKGMHVLAKFTPHLQSIGVWSDRKALTIIEAYPAACKNSKTIQELLRHYRLPSHPDDTHDALKCALIAHLFSCRPDKLIPPEEKVPESEGWIWVARDAIHQVG
ncbi:hypothetical protein AB4Z48_03040 [Cupriavidus sp. 2TAF22]|uniref:hypothetical protein n=1 Tax=unclassified Cupriavidus TaxID=2640874 RepID=UPI003F8F6557